MLMRPRSALPGFGPALGVTLLYLCLLVLIPLCGVFFKTATLTPAQFWHIVTTPRALTSYRLTIGAAAAAASLNVVFGVLVAWVLVRYPFPGRRVLDALVDLPFALPTAVAGIRSAFRSPSRPSASSWRSRSSAFRSSSVRCNRCCRISARKWRRRP